MKHSPPWALLAAIGAGVAYFAWSRQAAASAPYSNDQGIGFDDAVGQLNQSPAELDFPLLVTTAANIESLRDSLGNLPGPRSPLPLAFEGAPGGDVMWPGGSPTFQEGLPPGTPGSSIGNPLQPPPSGGGAGSPGTGYQPAAMNAAAVASAPVISGFNGGGGRGYLIP